MVWFDDFRTGSLPFCWWCSPVCVFEPLPPVNIVTLCEEYMGCSVAKLTKMTWKKFNKYEITLNCDIHIWRQCYYNDGATLLMTVTSSTCTYLDIIDSSWWQITSRAFECWWKSKGIKRTWCSVFQRHNMKF